MLKNKGLTLVEIMISAAILSTALTGILMFNSQYIKELQETRNLSLAMNAAQERFEKIKSRVNPQDATETTKIDFNNLAQYYNGLTFDIYGNNKTTALTNFKGVSYVKEVTGLPLKMFRVRVLVCWKNSQNQVMGEDANLNGALDTGEDKNNNSELDSPAFVQADLINMEQ